MFLRVNHKPCYYFEQWALALMNIAFSVPSIYLWVGLPLIMREHGWTGVEIGLFQIAALPSLLKYLMGISLDRCRINKQRNHYKVWTVLLSLLLLLSLIGLACTPLYLRPLALFAMAMSFSLVVNWLDVALSALAIRILPLNERLKAGSIRSAGLSFSAILGGGIMILVYSHFGWATPFMIMALILMIATIQLCYVKQSLPAISDSVISQPRQIFGFFSQTAAWKWSGILLLFFPSLATTWVYLKPLLLDYGFSVEYIAWLVGVWGGIIAAAVSLLIPGITHRFGFEKTLVYSALVALFALLSLVIATIWPQPKHLLPLAVIVMAIAMGCVASLSFTLMMYFTRQSTQAMDYGTQASLVSLSRLLLPMAVGLLLDQLGHSATMIILSTIMCGLVLFISYHRIIFTQLVKSHD